MLCALIHAGGAEYMWIHRNVKSILYPYSDAKNINSNRFNVFNGNFIGFTKMMLVSVGLYWWYGGCVGYWWDVVRWMGTSTLLPFFIFCPG